MTTNVDRWRGKNMALKRTILANDVGFRHVKIWSLHDFPVNKYNVILVAEISLNSERDIRPEQYT